MLKDANCHNYNIFYIAFLYYKISYRTSYHPFIHNNMHGSHNIIPHLHLYGPKYINPSTKFSLQSALHYREQLLIRTCVLSESTTLCVYQIPLKIRAGARSNITPTSALHVTTCHTISTSCASTRRSWRTPSVCQRISNSRPKIIPIIVYNWLVGF